MRLFGKIAVGAATTAAVLGVAILAGGYGFHAGRKVGFKTAMSDVAEVVEVGNLPTVALTYPGNRPVAIYRDGVCTPVVPGVKVPTHYSPVFVSPRWIPCTNAAASVPPTEVG